MKYTAMTALLSGMLLSCTPGKAGLEGRIVLDHRVIPGQHCESSAILNALAFQGFPLTEEQIIGAGAAPGFLYEKTAFPFLGGRSGSLKETFAEATGLGFEIRGPLQDPEWPAITGLLKEGTPVILRVDMRYLPYLFGGRYGPKYSSFGWHLVTLFGLDWQQGIAYVSDTAHREVQQIAVTDLEKARFSRTKVYPPRGEYYWFNGDPGDFRPDWTALADGSLKQIYAQMAQGAVDEKMLSGWPGLSALAGEIRALSTGRPARLVPAVLEFHYGSIETNGAGGAAFRSLYVRFLEQVPELSEAGNQALRQARVCEQRWHELADSCRDAAGAYGSADKAERQALLEAVAGRAESVFAAEEAFAAVLKENYDL